MKLFTRMKDLSLLRPPVIKWGAGSSDLARKGELMKTLKDTIRRSVVERTLCAMLSGLLMIPILGRLAY